MADWPWSTDESDVLGNSPDDLSASAYVPPGSDLLGPPAPGQSWAAQVETQDGPKPVKIFDSSVQGSLEDPHNVIPAGPPLPGGGSTDTPGDFSGGGSRGDAVLHQIGELGSDLGRAWDDTIDTVRRGVGAVNDAFDSASSAPYQLAAGVAVMAGLIYLFTRKD